MCRPPSVLFICTANYVRSRFAEAVFNYYADLTGLPWRAISRGFWPQALRGELSPQVEGALLARGISLRHLSPHKQALTQEDLDQASRIIALQESEHRPLMVTHFPDWVGRIEYWSAGDEQRWGMDSVLSYIHVKVENLVVALAREHVSRSA